MSGLVILPIILLGVYAIEVPHTTGEVSFRGLDDEVVMGIHEAVRMAQPLKTIDQFSEQFQKGDAVLMGPEYLLSTIPPGCYVV